MCAFGYDFVYVTTNMTGEYYVEIIFNYNILFSYLVFFASYPPQLP